MTTETSPTAALRVRPIEAGDEDGLLRLWRETWTSTYGPTLGAAALEAMLRGLDRGTAAMLPGRGERGYALAGGSRIVGSAVAAERGEVAYLWGLYVLPSHHRSGAGSRLLAAVARDLCTATVVEARVLRSSLQALAFYRARGFRAVGEETTEIMADVHCPALVLEAEAARLREMSA